MELEKLFELLEESEKLLKDPEYFFKRIYSLLAFSQDTKYYSIVIFLLTKYLISIRISVDDICKNIAIAQSLKEYNLAPLLEGNLKFKDILELLGRKIIEKQNEVRRN